jgi:hypothetical protein
MGALNIIISAFIFLIFILVFMQPVIILTDVAAGIINSNNPTTYGKDSTGATVDVGPALFGSDLIIGLMGLIGLAFLVGFIIWAARGGNNEYEEFNRGFS